jgi:hypothetical protein
MYKKLLSIKLLNSRYCLERFKRCLFTSLTIGSLVLLNSCEDSSSDSNAKLNNKVYLSSLKYVESNDKQYTTENNDSTISSTIAIGSSHTIIIKRDGTLWAWGHNYYGQLGDGTNTNRYATIKIGNDSDWKYIVVGHYHTVALKADGTLWIWGDNQYGQLGDGTNNSRNIPTKIGNNSDWVRVAIGYGHTTALKNNGTLWTWGSNYNGQLGDSTNISRNRPTKIGNDSDWVSVASRGYHTVALKKDGTLFGLGGIIVMGN